MNVTSSTADNLTTRNLTSANKMLIANKLTSNDLKSCYNALVWRLILRTPQSYAVGICIAMVTIPTIFINAALFIGLVRTKQPRNTSNMYIKLTSISGFLNGITGQPLYIILFTVYSSQRFCALEMAAVFAVQFNVHILGYAILLLAIDRYFSIHSSIKKGNTMGKLVSSKYGPYILLVMAFVFSTLHGLTSTFFFGFKKVSGLNIAMVIINCVIAIGVYIAYICLYFEMKKHVKQLSSILTIDQPTTGTMHKASQKPKYFDEFVKTVAIILIAGILCYLPFFVMDFWTGWFTYIKRSAAPQGIRFAYYLFVTPIFLYSSINSLLLLFRNSKAASYITNVCRIKHFETLDTVYSSLTPKCSNTIV